MDTAQLRFALKLAQPCIVGIDLIPVLQHFCFEEKRLFAYDEISAIVVGLDTGLHCALRADTLLKLVDLAGTEVELKQEGSDVVLSSGDRRKHVSRLPSLPPEEFVFEEPRASKSAMTFAGSDAFFDALSLCVGGVGKDPRFKDQVAVTMVTGDSAALYAYDGTSLVKVTLADGLGSDTRQVLIPKSICDQIIGLMDALSCDSDKATITLSKNHLSVVFEHEEWKVYLVGKLLAEQARVEEYEQAVNDASGGKRLIAIAEEFGPAVARVAAVVASETEKICRLEVEGSELRVLGTGALGNARTVLEIAAAKKPSSASVDPERLTRYRDRLTHIAINPDRIAMYNDGNPEKASMVYVAACYGD